MPQYLNKELSGDGRHSYEPNPKYETLGYGRLRLSQIRMLVEYFKERGTSYHSPWGTTLWAIQEWCILNNQTCFVGLTGKGGIVTKDEDKFKEFMRAARILSEAGL